MKYVGMPMGMWALFSHSFCRQLTAVFGYDKATAKAVTQKAKPKYKEIIYELPPFEKGDRFQMNIVNGYEGRFTKCGICELMKKLGLYDLTPAMCHLDYTMSDAGGVTDFVREYTLASGGPYCDCGYKKKAGR